MLRSVTSWPHLLSRCRKTIHSGYSCRSFLASGPTPPLSSFLIFLPMLGYSYTHSLSWHLTALLAGTLLPHPRPDLHTCTAPPLMVNLPSLYKNTPRLRPSSWPSLMPLWHTHQTPLIEVSSIRPPHPATGQCFVPRHRSGVQVYTFIS